jgi:hypothetical protein
MTLKYTLPHHYTESKSIPARKYFIFYEDHAYSSSQEKTYPLLSIRPVDQDWDWAQPSTD